jgi:hypothetical protein
VSPPPEAGAPVRPPAAAAAVPRPPEAPALPRWYFGCRLQARIGSDRVMVRLVKAGKVPRVVAQDMRTAEASDPSSSATGVDTIVALLGPALDALAARGVRLKGLDCDVVLDDLWMHYDVVRADLRSMPPRAADEIVRAALADIAGVDPSGIETCWQPQGGTAVACALPSGLLDRLREILRARGASLGSVEGELVHEFNRHLPLLQVPVCVLAIVRRSGAQLAVIANGAVGALSYEFGAGGPADLEMRARGLLHLATAGQGAEVRYLALAREGWPASAPWKSLALSA